MTPTSTPRPQISPPEGQRSARSSELWLTIVAWFWAILGLWAWWNGKDASFAFVVGCAASFAATVIHAMRALDRDRDGNPEGRDGVTGSVRSMTARSEGVAHHG